MARLHFTDRYPSSDRRKLSVNRFLRENIKAGLEGPDKAKYQLQGWAKSEYQSGPDRSIKLSRKVRTPDGGATFTECLVPKWDFGELTPDQPCARQPCLHRIVADCSCGFSRNRSLILL